eukprot:1161244-Pelagomonas_calceolata.AAC.22
MKEQGEVLRSMIAVLSLPHALCTPLMKSTPHECAIITARRGAAQPLPTRIVHATHEKHST